MDIDTEEKIPKEKPSEIVCTFCMKPTCQDFANIQQKSDLLELLKKLNVDILPVNNQIDWICYQCTYKLNCIRDYARTWASCVTKNRINYYYRLGEKEMVRRLLNLKNSKPLRSVSTDGGINQNALINSSHNQNEYKIKISSVRSIGTNDIPNNINEQFKFYENENYNDNNNDYNRGTPEQELLSVMYEKSEPVLHTESGHIYYRNEKNNTPTLLTCKKCHRVYKKLSFLKKHERKHERDELLKSKLQIQSPKNKNTTIKCKDCERTFTSLITWRKHYRIHQSGLKCMYCPAEFILPADLEMHEAICFGVLCAQDKGQQSHRYMTRSAHRTNYNDDNDNSCGFTTSDIDTMYTKRLNNARDWVSKTANNDNGNNIDNNETEEKQQLNDDEDNDDCQSLATTFTRASSHVNEQYSEEEEDDNDDLSTLTRPSVASENTIYGLNKRIKETDILYENSGKRPKISKNALDNYAKLVNCPEKTCNFITTSLERLLEHDLTVHDELPLFMCKKCGGRFLREIYLEDHLARQNPGRFLCTNCGKLFRFEHDLKYHLIDHGILNNKKKSKYCKICNLNFANSADYYNHLESINHFQIQKNTNFVGKKIKYENIEYEVYQGEPGKKEEIDEKEQKGEKIEVKQLQRELIEEEDEKEDIKAKFQDLFKDERKNLIYEQIMKDIKSNTILNMPSKIENLNETVDVNPTIEIKTEVMDNDYYNCSSFYKIKMETFKLNRVQPYKSEHKFRRYGKPFKRLEKVLFRRWKPHREPLRIKGEDYYNCAIRPYKNLL